MRRRTDRARAAAACLVPLLAMVLATSCWHPTFDPMLSASEATVRRLGDPTEYFAVKNVQQWDLDNAWFLPPMVDTPTAGLLVMDMGPRVALKSIWAIDVVNHSGMIDYSTGFDTINSLGDAYFVQASPDGSPRALFVSSRTGGTEVSSFYPLTTLNMTIPTTLGPFGIGAVAVSSVAQSSLSCFAYDGTPRYQAISTWSGGDPGFAATPTAFTFSAASQVTAPGRFLSTTIWLYLSCGLSDGSRAIFRWVNPPAGEPTQYTEDYGPLIGALSDGRLLAERDGIISVLDANLVRLFKFPAGTLRYVHERYDSANLLMKVVFTRTLFVRTSSHDDIGTLRVEVYEVPTADLASLAD